MSQRLRARDLALLAAESPSTPMHNATVEIFEPSGSGFDHDRLVALISERLSFVPRYRQRIRPVPGRLANPVWVDDPDFDLGYHVRRSALPAPGSMSQLRELVARIVSRPLDRSRPLWEVYFIEGLADGRVALLHKAHGVLVDGLDTLDLGQVLLDTTPEVKTLGDDAWQARRRPSSTALVRDALRDLTSQPSVVVDTARSRVASTWRGADDVLRGVGRVTSGFAGRHTERRDAISGTLSQQRRVDGAVTSLEDHRRIRAAHGGTVNDVVLATVTGALRAWLMTRGESLTGLRHVRALAPVSVIDDELEATSLGSQVAPHYVELPVGEASPVVRLHQVSYSFRAHRETGRGVAADRLAGLAGFAPTTFHALGARVAFAEQQRRGFQLAVTNVPGPQSPLYAAGARMVTTFPVPALLPGHAIAIGVTSYDGSVYYGLTADRDLVPDAHVLAECFTEALDELLDSAVGSRQRAPRGRRAGAKPASAKSAGAKSAGAKSASAKSGSGKQSRS
ncbi:WS/DGAT/MGAT family O-acyltransferase [Nocardioides pantholopis]|uniref:WS/DGAT/MGAT family O-acyltransferase n=1 Tax=Nocardioides pantholopis TaxID=2483798 RepID=UPI000F073D62|nr:wax ester/triacylglycerol synthase family O-acyltransferase [Nocardioides pantholopis]